MEIINTVIAVVAAVGSLVVIVGTVVWAVGQIQATTQNLSLEIKHLAERITVMGHDLGGRVDDHEERLRAVEQKR
jgi:predicted PurR-regulated permease PerM